MEALFVRDPEMRKFCRNGTYDKVIDLIINQAEFAGISEKGRSEFACHAVNHCIMRVLAGAEYACTGHALAVPDDEHVILAFKP